MNGTSHSPNGVHANGTSKKRRFSETGLNDSNTDRIQTKSSPFKQQNNANFIDERKKMDEHRKRLPIFEARQKIIDHLKTHNNLVIIGETGSGKTTQVCQYLVESGLVSDKAAVAVTQPRRVAARSVAQRVSQEVGKGLLGTYVGYSVRFEHVYNDKTRIKFLTDGMLLRELQLDPLLSGYEAIILDEAHERTLNTDLLFGLLKLLQNSKRPQLKIIVMSATLEADLFAEYFKTTVFYVQGRMFPIEVFYTSRAEKNYVDAAMLTVMQIHEEQESGDILVFMTGREEIETLCKLLSERIQFLSPESDTLLLVPLYGALTPELQSKVFEPTPPKTRKVVVSTNIAETSITVPNIRYVIDPGVVKARLAGASITVSGGTGGSRDQVTPMTSSALVVVSVSRSQAWQRAGRCGRVAGGKVYRLYTEETFLSLPISFPAEIKRVSLETLVLTLLNLGHRDVLNFPYLQQPAPQALKKALEMLWILGALSKDGSLSDLGKQMALFPLEPLYSRVLIASQQFKCTDEVITILAMLSSENVFIFPQHIGRPSGEDVDLTGVKRPFAHPDGDLLVLLNVYKAYQESGQSNHWCKKFNINGKAMKKAVQIREQLSNYWQTMCAVMRKKANNSDEAQKNYPETISSCDGNDAQIRKCFAAGFFLHAATLVTSGGNARASYQLLMQQQTAFIHPTSILSGTKPKCVIFSELVFTSKYYMRDVIVVEPEWLIELAPQFCKVRMNMKS